MPKGPRLQHTKSRTGCLRCKKRKVKCDETKPTCNNCTRHELSCQYGSEDIRHRFGSKDRSSHGSIQQQEVGIEDILEPDERRLLELQLLHHFVSVVSYTFPSSDLRIARETWINYAVGSSFKNPMLLNAIFAITALHLLNGASTATRFFVEDHDQDAVARVSKAHMDLVCRIPPAVLHPVYLSLAIKQQQDAVASQHAEDPDIINAVFLSTVLLSYQALTPQSEMDETRQLYRPPTHWLRMVHGITSAAGMVTDMCNNLPHRDTTRENLVQFLATQGGAPDFRDEVAIFDPAHREPFQALLDWVNYPEPSSNGENYIATYEKALSYVGGVYRGIMDGEPPRTLFRRILCFGIKVPPEFTALVEERRPRAIAILALHCAMAYCVDDHWVFHGFAEREVAGLGSLLPPEWFWVMKWPTEIIYSLKEKHCDFR